MTQIDKASHPHAQMVYRGYEFTVHPPIELSRTVEPPHAEVVVLAYLGEEFGMSEDDLLGTAQKLGDQLDRVGFILAGADPHAGSKIGKVRDVIEDWLPRHEITLPWD